VTKLSRCVYCLSVCILCLLGCAREKTTGNVIAFTSINANNPRSSQIELLAVESGDITPLPNSQGSGSGWAPAWSPDGKWIAYIVHVNNRNWPLYIIGADGEHKQKVLSGDLYHFPCWSPDGRQLSYSRNGNIWLAEISLNGDEFTLINQRQLTFLDRQYASVSSWSPDGQQIVFSSQMGDALGTAAYSDTTTAEIYIINVDGSGLQQLTNNTVHDNGARLSPDGQWIAFTSYRDGNYDIYAMRIDGTDVHNLTNNPASDGSPTWSPDGTQIAFVSDRDGNDEIYLMQADGSQPTRLTQTTSSDLNPAWQP
jgi:Tol biopolymer transport system component